MRNLILYLIKYYIFFRMHLIVYLYNQVFLFLFALIKINKMYLTLSIILIVVVLALFVTFYVNANQQYVKSIY